jgi:transitional endoplasmic reticulum ATPase
MNVEGASRGSLNSTMEEPSEECEGSLTLVVDENSLSERHVVGISHQDVGTLGNCNYVWIGQQIYKILPTDDVSPGSVLLPSELTEEYDDEVTVRHCIPEDEGVVDATQAHFIISSTDDCFTRGDNLIPLDQLRQLFYDTFTGHVFQHGHKFSITDDISGELQAKEKFGAAPLYLRVHQATRLLFEPEEGDPCIIAQIVNPTDALSFKYHITVETFGTETPSRKDGNSLADFFAAMATSGARTDAGTAASVLPKLMKIDELETWTRKKIKDSLLTLGNEVSFPLPNGDQVSLELVNVRTPGALPTSMIEIPTDTIPVPKAYKFSPHSQIEFSSDVDSVVLVKGKPVRARTVQFAIYDILGESISPVKGIAHTWLLKDKIEKKIREVLNEFVLTSRFAITYDGVQYGIQVIDASPETAYRDSMMDEHSFWIFGRKCEFSITAAEQLNHTIVSDTTPMALSSIKFVVSSRGHSEAKISVSLNALRVAVEEKLSGVLLPNHTYTVTVDGAQLEVKVERYMYTSDELNSSPEIYLGQISNKTKVEFTAKKGGALVLRSTPKPLTDRDPIEALQELGLTGYDEEIEKAIRLLCALFGKGKEFAKSRDVTVPKGFLLKGPPGTGKTSLAHALCQLVGVDKSNIKEISADQVKSMWLGNTEQNIRSLFADAQQAWERGHKDLYVIIIDEFDALAAKRGGLDEHSNKFTNCLLAQMDGLNKSSNVLVIGTTNHDALIDPAFLRPGRFDKQLQFKMPSLHGRLGIFEVHTRAMRAAKQVSPDVNFNQLASMTDGMNGAHIQGIVAAAKDQCMLRVIGTKLPQNSSELLVSMADFVTAYKEISHKGDVLQTLPQLDDVYTAAVEPANYHHFCEAHGLVAVKQEHMHTLSLVAAAYRKNPKTMEVLDVSAPRGVLFYGNPGSGKSSMLVALLKMMGVGRHRVTCLHSRDLLQKLHSSREEFDMRTLFSPAYQTWKSDPKTAELQVIIVEDIHLLKNGTALEAFLHALDQVKNLNNLLVIATASKPDDSEEGAKFLQMLEQPGRFDHAVKTKAPDYLQRIAFFRKALTDATRRKLTCGEFFEPPLADATQHFSWGQLQKVVDYVKLELKRLVELGITSIGISQNLVLEAAKRIGSEITCKRRTAHTKIERATIPADTVKEYLAKFGLLGVSEQVLDCLTLLTLQYNSARTQAAELRLKPARGVLLAGEPGAGKTKISHAIINMLGVTDDQLQQVTARDLLADLKEGRLNDLSGMFKEARKSAEVAPARPWVVLFEDLDQLGDELIIELTQKLDEVRDLPNLLIIGTLKTASKATKPPKALLGSGRFEKLLSLKNPNFGQRLEQIEHYLKPVKNKLKDVTAKFIATATEGFTPGQIEAVITKAKEKALLRLCKQTEIMITKDDFVDAVGAVKGGMHEEIQGLYM